MKRKLIFVTILLMAVVLAMAIPVSAAQKVPIGDRIFVNAGDQNFQAGAPFHIMHGWTFGSGPGEGMRGLYGFELEIDGAYQEPDFTLHVRYPDYDLLGIQWVFNFPEGMTGTHTFTGHWIAPCKPFEEWFGPCSSPSEQIEVFTASASITFE
jgi:hypothetical protein